MGINLVAPLFVLSLFVTSGLSAAGTLKVEEARQGLKDYALAGCLKRLEPKQTQLADDLGRMMGTLHFMGKGAHQIIQNEDTFETVHDPYQESFQYLTDLSAQYKGNMKNGMITWSMGCITAYRSDQFNEFIRSQDQYISN